MKKFIDLMLAAIMICGASVFTSCNTDAIDNPESISSHLPRLILVLRLTIILRKLTAGLT